MLASTPVLASAVRVTTALLAFGVLYALSPRYSRAHHPLNWTVFRQTLVSGWIGMGLGMGLLLWALREGPVGSVGVLSGLSPVLICLCCGGNLVARLPSVHG